MQQLRTLLFSTCSKGCIAACVCQVIIWLCAPRCELPQCLRQVTRSTHFEPPATHTRACYVCTGRAPGSAGTLANLSFDLNMICVRGARTLRQRGHAGHARAHPLRQLRHSTRAAAARPAPGAGSRSRKPCPQPWARRSPPAYPRDGQMRRPGRCHRCGGAEAPGPPGCSCQANAPVRNPGRQC